MSLPLRFKAVRKDCGAEMFTGDLLFLSQPPFNIYVDDPYYQLCQSTGLKDSQGKEVFFGDVIMSLREGGMYIVDLGLIHTMDIDLCVVIGNKFEAVDVITQRAEALTHD
jgi:uncharacterized phage protein (TIGR01671 family)